MESTLPKKIAWADQPLAKTLGYYAAFVALGLTTSSLGPTLTGLAENTRTQLSAISYLFTARSLGYLLGSLQGGRLYDRVPGHPLMAAVLFVAAAMMALIPLTPLLGLLLALMFILGMAEGALDVGGNTLIVWVQRDKVAPYMNGLHFFFGVGALLSPVIVGQAITAAGGITWAYWAIAGLVLPAALILLRLTSPVNQAVAAGSPAARSDNSLTATLAVFFFLSVGCEVSFGGWIFTYATRLGLGSQASAAYLTSAFWGALTAGRLLSIPLATRLPPRRFLLIDLAGCLLSVSLILLFPASNPVVWAGTLGMGLSMASIFPTTLSLAGRHMTITGRVTSWFFVGASLGGMVLPWLIGQLFDSFGPLVTMISILVDLLIAIAVFGVLVSQTNRRRAPSRAS